MSNSRGTKTVPAWVFALLWVLAFIVDACRCERQTQGFFGKDSKPTTTVSSSSFTADMTPIILAAHRNHYEIVKVHTRSSRCCWTAATSFRGRTTRAVAVTNACVAPQTTASSTRARASTPTAHWPARRWSRCPVVIPSSRRSSSASN